MLGPPWNYRTQDIVPGAEPQPQWRWPSGTETQSTSSRVTIQSFSYRAIFLVSEIFSVSAAATNLDNRGLVLLFAAFGVSWLIVWISVTTLRAKVVEFFEKHAEDGALMQYHNLTEGRAHRAGFWIFTIVFPAMFGLFWLTLILLAYGTIRIG